MDVAELERYLHEHIPLSRAMAVSVVSATPTEVLLSAPLAPNINHRDTVFGGSASAICILAAWALVHVRLREAGVVARLVIQRNTMEYLHAVDGVFSARAFFAGEQEWQRFMWTLQRRRRARVDINAALESAGRTAGTLEGTFVALL